MNELKSYIHKDKKVSIQKQCDLLGVPISSFYYKPKGESNENLKIMRHMDDEFLEHPTHGVLQIQDFLFALGYIINAKRVRRL
jgi:putative transposase